MNTSVQQSTPFQLLTKGAPFQLKPKGLAQTIHIGCGWNENPAPNQPDFDVDLGAILLRGGKLIAGNDVIYQSRDLGTSRHVSGAIFLGGDNRDGKGDGDDESCTISFAKLPADVDGIVLMVTIYEATVRHQHFGMVNGASVRVCDGPDGSAPQLAKSDFDLARGGNGFMALEYGRFIKDVTDNSWSFTAKGDGIPLTEAEVRANNGIVMQAALTGYL